MVDLPVLRKHNNYGNMGYLGDFWSVSIKSNFFFLFRLGRVSSDCKTRN